MNRWQRATRRLPVRLLAAGVALVVVTWLAAAALTAPGSGAPAGRDAVSSGGSSGAARPGIAAGPAEADAPAAKLDQRAAPMPAPAPGAPAPVNPDLIGQERAVVRTARLTLDVADPPAASARVRAAACGFVANEQTRDRAANLTLRVPATRLDELIGQLTGPGGVGRVTDRAEQAEDVTDQMADLEGRLNNQRASVARIRALLERAVTVGDVVAIESELTQRQGELESLEKRMAAVSGRVALATLTVTLNPEAPPPLAEAPGGFLAGLAAGWRAFLATGTAVLTVLGVLAPFLAALAVIVGLLLGARGTLRRGRRAASGESAATGSGG
ncbi:hypothetical protein GCM10023321_28540 [Pseudonocardia eucalypti]|uniref:DUF4349 domain-containing protein n=1 Tax=Pseudonocardia eucalypti TaxID=648755 RepID=A0ABP9Q1I1_9PSEU|nr:hypothetical protein [Pseudonocardia eucalypti]